MTVKEVLCPVCGKKLAEGLDEGVLLIRCRSKTCGNKVRVIDKRITVVLG